MRVSAVATDWSVKISCNDSPLVSQGNYEEAEEMYRRSLAIREKVLGADHPDVAEGLNNLAVLLERVVRIELLEMASAPHVVQ